METTLSKVSAEWETKWSRMREDDRRLFSVCHHLFQAINEMMSVSKSVTPSVTPIIREQDLKYIVRSMYERMTEDLGITDADIERASRCLKRRGWPIHLKWKLSNVKEMAGVNND